MQRKMKLMKKIVEFIEKRFEINYFSANMINLEKIINKYDIDMKTKFITKVNAYELDDFLESGNVNLRD